MWAAVRRQRQAASVDGLRTARSKRGDGGGEDDNVEGGGDAEGGMSNESGRQRVRVEASAAAVAREIDGGKGNGGGRQ